MSDLQAIQLDQQMDFEDVSDEYKAFVEKFKPKKTTDDCYTPKPVYDAVLSYCVDRYGIDPEDVVRPFWPGMDYTREAYPPGCCVIDNPPFSIISKIVRDFAARGVRFFLFAPYLTLFSTNHTEVTYIVAPETVVYENGAKVSTSFVTNLEPGVLARSDPELLKAIKKANRENFALTKEKAALPKYAYPVHVLTASMLGYMANHGVAFSVDERDATFVRRIDAQISVRKEIFGSGFLLSEKAAAEKAAAEKAAAEKAAAEKAAAEKAAAEKAAALVFELSDREKTIVRGLGTRPARDGG